MSDLNKWYELERVAKEAQNPWFDKDSLEAFTEFNPCDIDYVFMADPATILELLAENKRLAEQLEMTKYDLGCYSMPNPAAPAVPKEWLNILASMINLVEGLPAHEWRDKFNQRLKDSHEWVEFYVKANELLKSAEVKNGNQSADNIIDALLNPIPELLSGAGEYM